MKFGIAFANIGPFIGPDRACDLGPDRREGRASSRSGRSITWWCRPATGRGTPTTRRVACRRARTRLFPIRLIWLAYVARATSTIRLATGILILPQRNPLVLAKELATLDHLSSGRVTLGVGIGWLKEEFEALGIPFEGRGERTEEAIAAMRALWSQDRATMDGDDGALSRRLLAAPAAGGSDPRPCRRSQRGGRPTGPAGSGTGSFPFGVDRDELPHLVDTMRRAAEAADRDPSSVELTVSSYGVDPTTRPWPMSGLWPSWARRGW